MDLFNKSENRITVSEEIQSLYAAHTNSELIIGIVGAVGKENQLVVDTLKEKLGNYRYITKVIKVSNDVIRILSDEIKDKTYNKEFDRINGYMDAGNKLRQKFHRNDILALGTLNVIKNKYRRNIKNVSKRNVYIIDSLKHPDEVKTLRSIYTDGFYLIGVYSDQSLREEYLENKKQMSKEEIKQLMNRDEDELLDYGQKTRDTFYLSDYFIELDSNRHKYQGDIERFVQLLFGHPYTTPIFDEYAMFIAFAASLRSGDLSRQVGAVISHGQDILAIGANDVPKYRGGQYMSHYDNKKQNIVDDEGRDYIRGYDENEKLKNEIMDKIINSINSLEIEESLLRTVINVVQSSGIMDITEFGRSVHAEMEALLACARNGISCRGGTLFTTTFPCHNCAKHIVGAGIERVVYVEPYPKSKAFDLHSDSITKNVNDAGYKVTFEPFVGVGARKFYDLFSISRSSGYDIIRKIDGKTVKWNKPEAELRLPLDPKSYIEREKYYINLLRKFINGTGA